MPIKQVFSLIHTQTEMSKNFFNESKTRPVCLKNRKYIDTALPILGGIRYKVSGIIL
jgi:hypothetical protein